MNKRSINVTQPFLPPLEEYVEYLKGIWERNYLTNQGPLVKELEQKLQHYHRLEKPVHCVANGGLGLQIALKALGVKGEVITTPFSYVATTSCPLWEGCSVKFADIEPDYLTLDPKAVEAAITPQTEAILATHVFGNPCDVEAFEILAKKHGLALIYDAAHAFGVTYKGRSILEWGDASMVSLHATKLFHTVEGGFVYSPHEEIAQKIEWMRRFGHDGPKRFHGVALNAKMSEIHAAMGLAILKYLPQILIKRVESTRIYNAYFEKTTSIKLALKLRNGADWNSAYYPVLFESEKILLRIMKVLEENEIYTRRYFYPSLDIVTNADSPCPISHDITSRIMCLPISGTLGDKARGIAEKIVKSL